MSEPALRLVPPADDGPGADAADAPAIDAKADATVDARVDAEPDASADASTDTPKMPGLAVTPQDVVAVTLRHWAGMVTASARKSMSQPGTVLTDEPPSIAHIAAYYRASAWVPDHHEAEWLRAAGRAYGYCVGIPAVAFLYGLAWLFARPVRIGLVLLVAGAVTIAALA